jgi:hypothetical protein
MKNCSLKDKDYLGNCEFCNERTYCMLRDIMEKLQDLEFKIARMKAETVS